MSILKAIYGSDKTALKLGGIEIPCYVLENEKRVFSGRGLQQAIGYKGSSGSWITKAFLDRVVPQHYRAGIEHKLLQRIEFKRATAGGSQSKAYGYEVTVLIDLCDLLIDAKNTGFLSPQYHIYADQANIILRAVAKVGIIGLVDEVTGFDQVRERFELNRLLDIYITDEAQQWAKRFPDEFYRLIFQLNGWPYSPNTVKRPSVIGTWTKNIIYKRFPPKILKHLEYKNPKNLKGNRNKRHHQFLTEDIGNPELKEYIGNVIFMMKGSNNWKDFQRRFKRVMGDYDGELFRDEDIG